MTGFRASPLRRKCAMCERLFRPARRDADYCKPACQKAASRERIKKAQLLAEAEAVFKVAVNSHLLRQRLERHQGGALAIAGFEGIQAIATERGYLIAGEPEALTRLYGTMWVQSCKPSFILPEELPGLLRVYPGGPFRYREIERDFLRRLKGTEPVFILLEDDAEYYADVPPPTVPWFERPGIPNDEDDLIPFDNPGPRLSSFEILEWREMVEKAERELTAIDKDWFKSDKE